LTSGTPGRTRKPSIAGSGHASNSVGGRFHGEKARGLQEAVSGAKSNRWHSPCSWLPFLKLRRRSLGEVKPDWAPDRLESKTAGGEVFRAGKLAIGQ
jgi:hypothetical protein